jgi:RimJ/RimL family protein N-acetyltransferase
MNFVFDALGWTEVIYTTGPDNVRSIALAQRLGTTTGELSPPPRSASGLEG